MKYLSLVFRNLTRNKRRTILTMLSIAVSVFIFASLISLPGLLDQILRDRANSRRLITHSKAGFLYVLPESDRRQIETLPHVEGVAAYSVFPATYRDPSVQLGVLAVDDDHIPEIFPDWGVSAETLHEFTSIRIAALVATHLMDLYGWHVGQNIMLHGSQYPVNLQLTIVGVISEEASGPRIIFRRDSIVARILVEGLIVGVVGGVLGCALALGGIALLPHVSGALGPLALAITVQPRVIAYSFAIAAAIGAVSGLIPATLATRGDIATELRAI